MKGFLIAVDNAFNRANYPHLIGQRFDPAKPPSYVALKYEQAKIGEDKTPA